MSEQTFGEWAVIEALLPVGWEQAARKYKAFRRSRYLQDPAAVLRLLLFHAVNDGSLRATVAQAVVGGIASISSVGLFKRMRTAGEWIGWIAGKLADDRRHSVHVPERLRPRVIDSTVVQGPAAKGTEWRVHYSLDLRTMLCDWLELTDGKGAELVERTPIQPGDVLIADRNYLRSAGIKHVVGEQGHVLMRLRWNHCKMVDADGARFLALEQAKALQVGEVGSWPVGIECDGEVLSGRVVATRLPKPVAEKAMRKAAKALRKKRARVKLNPRSLEAAQLIMLFTTLPEQELSDTDVLELYRYRWQVELAFKRHKQLLSLGRLPHKDPLAAKTWILAKLVIALLLETLYRKAVSFSPWGYHLPSLQQALLRRTTP
jgi:hypothetical protein